MMDTEAPVDERRRAPRLPVSVPIELKNGTGITRDISGLGVFFYGPYPFEKDETVEFLLRIPGAIPVRCTGSIVRSDYDREGMRYGVAVTIDNYDVADSDQDDTAEPHIVLRELRTHHD